MEADRPLDAPVSEIDIAELGLRASPVDSDAQIDILEFRALESLGSGSHGSLSVNMSLQRLVRLTEHLVTLRDKGSQGRKERGHSVSESLRPGIAVSRRAGHRIGKTSRRDDELIALVHLTVGAADIEARENRNDLLPCEQDHTQTEHGLDHSVKHLGSPV